MSGKSSTTRTIKKSTSHFPVLVNIGHDIHESRYTFVVLQPMLINYDCSREVQLDASQ